MKSGKDRSQEAEVRIQETEVGSQQAGREVPGWWLEVPAAEKAVIRDVLTSIRGLKGSRSPQVGLAARKWERSIACFIKFRLMGERPRSRDRIISSRSASRNPRGASPARD